MIHRNYKEIRDINEKRTQLFLKEDISKVYMRKQSKSNWLSWSNRYGYRVVFMLRSVRRLFKYG